MKTLYDGKHTKVIEVEGCEMIQRVPASAILAFDEDEVIMVEQERGSFGKILEVPAGKVEFNEDPSKTAVRELEEETGFIARNCYPLISYYPSVGYTTEQIYCYYTTGVYLGTQRLDDGENVNVKKFKWDTLLEMIYNGEIKDSKTLMCVLVYKQKFGI